MNANPLVFRDIDFSNIFLDSGMFFLHFSKAQTFKLVLSRDKFFNNEKHLLLMSRTRSECNKMCLHSTSASTHPSLPLDASFEFRFIRKKHVGETSERDSARRERC